MRYVMDEIEEGLKFCGLMLALSPVIMAIAAAVLSNLN